MRAPLTPPDCDLRDFHYLPLEVDRLLKSEFHNAASDSEWRAGVTLLLQAWHQVPAASLPSDERRLARLADLRDGEKSWPKVREHALRGWEQSTDGRLYHPILAESALNSWISKLTQRIKSAAGHKKRHGVDIDRSFLDAQKEQAVTYLKALNPRSKALTKLRKQVDDEVATGSGTGSANSDATSTYTSPSPYTSPYPFRKKGVSTVVGDQANSGEIDPDWEARH